MKKFVFLVLSLVFLGAFSNLSAQKYRDLKGDVRFTSDAPLEIIKAGSSSLFAVVNVETRGFFFKVGMQSFEGFNSRLQREHFNENYMESAKYPDATFAGKIVEDVDLSKPGTYEVRAKGILKIHGQDQERVIPVKVTSTGSSLRVDASFEVRLVDHKIKIPTAVTKKIAETIKVTVKLNLNKD
jgi:polyisoprenoid-binding protein YceI